MTELSEAQRAVLAATRRELRRIGEDQQQLADDLAELLGETASVDVIRRMQTFALLRQRVDLLAEALAVLEAMPSADLAEAVPTCLTLASLRQDFAAALGVAAEAGEDGEEIELF